MDKTIEERYKNLEKITQTAKEKVNKLEATLAVQNEAYEERKSALTELGIEYTSLQELKEIYLNHKENLSNLMEEMENQAGIDNQ